MIKAAKQFGRETKEFLRLPSTDEYIEALENVGFSHFYIVNRSRYGGSWAHSTLAVFFARWLDARFAVACDQMIDDILRGKAQVVSAQPAQPQVPQTIGQALRLAADQNEQL